MISKHVKRLLGIGTRVQPVTTNDVEASKPTNPAIEKTTETAKQELIDAIDNLHIQAIRVRKLLLNETLDWVGKQPPSGKAKRK